VVEANEQAKMISHRNEAKMISHIGMNKLKLRNPIYKTDPIVGLFYATKG
jgi:hypothetical protein